MQVTSGPRVIRSVAAASAAIEAASAARERATRAAKDFREAEDRVPADH